MNKCFCHFNGYEVKDAYARTELEKANSEIEKTNNEIEKTNDEIEQIKEKIKNPRKMIFIGDSYGAYDTSWIDLLGTKLGVDYYKFAVGGAGFSNIGSLGKNFLMILQDNINQIEDKESITHIVVGGGYNDNTQTYEDIKTAIFEFTQYCNTNFPNAKVYIALLGFNTNMTTDSAYARKSIAEVVYPAYSFNYNMDNPPIFIENSQFILRDSNFTDTDGIHPNAEGLSKIASALSKYFNGGCISVVYPITTNHLTINSKDYTFISFIDNNLLTIRLPEEIYTLNNITLTAGNSRKNRSNLLGTFSSNVIFPNVTGDLTLKGKFSMHYLKNGVDTAECIDGELYFSTEGSIYFTFNDIENNAFKTYQNVTSISPLTYIDKTVSRILN